MTFGTNTFPELSKRELDIIKIVWRLNRASLREVHNELTKTTELAYPTTKTVLDRMVTKGYLRRENVHGIFVYSSLLSKPSGLAGLVQNFIENVLEIDAGAITSLFANSKMLTPEETAELLPHYPGFGVPRKSQSH